MNVIDTVDQFFDYRFVICAVLIVALLLIAFIIIFIIKMSKFNQLVEGLNRILKELYPSEGKPQPEMAIGGSSVNSNQPEEGLRDEKTILSLKEQILSCIKLRSIPVEVEDLPRVEAEMMRYFETYANTDYFSSFSSKDYYRMIDLSGKPDTRVVVVGDVHSDFTTLSYLLRKIASSEYDYFEKGYVVFLGDFLDRGDILFETILLLLDLKAIMGDRCIILKGNHELISYDQESQQLVSKVRPQESCPCLNSNCGDNKAFLKAFGDFFSTLPTYVYLKTDVDNELLVHAAFPQDKFLDRFYFSTETGEIIFAESPFEKLVDCKRNNDESIDDFAAHDLPEVSSFMSEFSITESLKIVSTHKDNKCNPDIISAISTVTEQELLTERNKILRDMIWGDPSENDYKMQSDGRFQFGRLQFEAYASKNKINRLFRSHESVVKGHKPFYDGHLFTVFSTGGSKNPDTGYTEVKAPSFAVIKNTGEYFFENIFTYKLNILNRMDVYYHALEDTLLTSEEARDYTMNDEFKCNDATITNLFK